MEFVLAEIWLPILLTFLFTTLICFMAWRWRRTKIKSSEWEETQRRASKSDSEIRTLRSRGDELDRERNALNGQVTGMRRELEENRNEVALLRSSAEQADEANNRAADAEHRTAQLEAELGDNNKRLASYEEQFTAAQNRSAGAEQELAELRGQIGRYEDELGQTRQRANDWEARHAQDTEQIRADYEREMSASRSSAVELERNLATLQANTKRTESEFAASRKQLDADLTRSKQETSNLSNKLRERDGQIARFAQVETELTTTKRDSANRISDLEEKLKARDATVAAMEKQATERANRLSTLERDVAATRARETELEAALGDITDRTQRAEAELHSAQVDSANLIARASSGEDRTSAWSGPDSGSSAGPTSRTGTSWTDTSRPDSYSGAGFISGADRTSLSDRFQTIREKVSEVDLRDTANRTRSAAGERIPSSDATTGAGENAETLLDQAKAFWRDRTK